jgi:two-component system chemotaxis response regulator CheB
MRVIRVLVVDDSAVVRQSTRFILESDPELQVIGEAPNGEEAVRLAEQLKPDVITMDIRMPRMDGMEAIANIMASNPAPIVVVTSIDLERDLGISTQATKAGAVAVLMRPTAIASPKHKAFAEKLIAQVKLMSAVKVIHRPRAVSAPARPSVSAPVMPSPSAADARARKIEIVAIGSSTGGPAALHQLLGALPANFPTPILIVQHISFGFVEGLASWLDAACALRVKVAANGERITSGTVYIAPDGNHLMTDRFGKIVLSQTDPVGGFRPAVTVLFEAVARSHESAALGIILTGMGSDGAKGMVALRNAGAWTIAQDEASCVVFGMPKEAMALGAVTQVEPLARIAPRMVELCAVEGTSR